MKWTWLKVIVLLLFFSTLQAQNQKIVVPTDVWEPFRIHNSQNFTGIDYDLLKELSKRLQWDIEYKLYPWSRSLSTMKSGEVDLMTGLAKRAERQEYILYSSSSYFSCSSVFYVRKGNAHLINRYDDLYRFLVGYVLESAYFERFDDDMVLKKIGVGSENQLIRLLMAKRIQVFIGTDCQADYEIAKQGLQDKIEKANFHPKNSVDLYLGISKNSAFVKDINRINQALEEIIKEGKIKTFSNKYYAP